jgi:hypothetical protein
MEIPRSQRWPHKRLVLRRFRPGDLDAFVARARPRDRPLPELGWAVPAQPSLPVRARAGGHPSDTRRRAGPQQVKPDQAGLFDTTDRRNAQC